MKKFVYCFLILIVSVFTLTPSVVAENLSLSEGKISVTKLTNSSDEKVDDFSHNCADFAKTIRIGGYLIFGVKILLPIVIIVKATMNMFSMVTNAGPEELKKQAKKLMNSLIAAIIIFFLPTLLDTLFGFVNNYTANKTEDSKICAACIFDPFSSTCTDHIDEE